MNNLDMNDPEIRKNIFVSLIVLILFTVLITLLFTLVGWKWGTAGLLGAIAFFAILGRP